MTEELHKLQNNFLNTFLTYLMRILENIFRFTINELKSINTVLLLYFKDHFNHNLLLKIPKIASLKILSLQCIILLLDIMYFYLNPNY